MNSLGICLSSFVAVRAEPGSASEMVTSLLFGETYTVLEEVNDFLKIRMDTDGYEGWISSASYSLPQEDFTVINSYVFLEAHALHQVMYLPCASLLPESMTFEKNGQLFKINRKLKTPDHLPLEIRLQKLTSLFMNTPYLWGGRSFMGIDCSGFMQVVFKANGIDLPRDAKQQAGMGNPVHVTDSKPCDLVFFSKPDDVKITHVGMLLDENIVIHAGSSVRRDKLEDGFMHADGKVTYRLSEIRRIIPEYE